MFNKSIILFTQKPVHRLQPFIQCQLNRCFSSDKSKSPEQKPCTNKNERLIKIAVIGVPNAGKSTFINNLINHRVS